MEPEPDPGNWDFRTEEPGNKKSGYLTSLIPKKDNIKQAVAPSKMVPEPQMGYQMKDGKPENAMGH